MTIEHDEAALREVLRQGERMLVVQQESRESALRRAGELLRLAVATLGGLVVVGGLLSAADITPDGFSITAMAVGASLVVFSIFVFSMILTGHRWFGIFAYGPDLERIVDEMNGRGLHNDALLQGLSRNMPEMLQVNASGIAHIQRAKANALLALTSGSVLLLGTILYIIVGAIYA